MMPCAAAWACRRKRQTRRSCSAWDGWPRKKTQQNLPDAVLLIVGDGPERAVLEQQAQSLGVADRVIFVGAVPPAEVPRYYALGDVFVSASTSEAQGLTYIEAMAAGLPLLCHADPCLDALVREGETGWAYHTPAELAARAAALPKGHQLAAMRQNARRAVQPYTKEQFGLSVVRLYAAALGRKHAARSAAGGNVA
jgi:1,2-diacylglycerol 3-alpha-glucosyltransferase